MNTCSCRQTLRLRRPGITARRKLLWLLNLALAGLVPYLSPSPAAGQASSFAAIAEHPEAVWQTTELGRTLHTLSESNGQLFVGYGDWASDTGPIHLRSFQIAQLSFGPVLVTSQTEALSRFSVIDGTVFSPLTDPIGFQSGGYVSGPPEASSWTENDSLSGLHFFDFFAADANTFYLAGSGGPTAIENSILYQSHDGGNTWSLLLDLPVPASEPHSFAFTRFYGIGHLNGSLYVEQMLFNSSRSVSGIEPLSMLRYDGNSWTDLGRITTTAGDATWLVDPDTFANRIVSRNGQSGQTLSPLFAFDGMTLSKINVPGSVSSETWDHYIFGDELFVLTDAHTILKSANLIDWTVVATDVPSQLRSLAVTTHDVWLGGTDGALYRYALVPEPAVGTWVLLAISGLALRRRGLDR